MLPVLKDTASWITGTLIPAIRNFGRWLLDNKDTILIIASAVAGFVAALRTINYIKTVTVAVKAATIAFKAFGTALLANPMGIIIAAIAALAAGLAYFFTQTETGRAIWASVWGGIQAVAQAVADWFTGTLLPVLQTVWDGIMAAAEVAAKWYTEHVAPIFEEFGKLLTAVWEVIIEKATELQDFLVVVWEVLLTAWGVLWEQIKAVWDAIGPPIIAAINGAFEHMKIIVTTIWNIIRAVIETVLGVGYRLGLGRDR